MLQRIQTVYLLVATILAFCSLAFDLFIQNEMVISATGHLALLISGALMIADTVAPIFLYTNRSLQKRICYMAILMQVLFIVALLVTVNKTVPGGIRGIEGFQMASIFPVINIILIYLAIRGINKDEELIKSMDRLR
jgi:hypothetical protein